MELVKLLGGVAWAAGVVLLFVYAPLGVVVLLVAVYLSALSVRKTRERRHQELLDAQKK